jgi:hypothetical protein
MQIVKTQGCVGFWWNDSHVMRFILPKFVSIYYKQVIKAFMFFQVMLYVSYEHSANS